MPFRMVRWLWFGRPVRGLSGGSNGSKRRHCASVKSLRLTRATWALRAGLVPLCRHAVGETATRELQLNGQLFYLTLNNAPLVQALHAAEKQNPLASTLDLAIRGYHDPGKWMPLIDESIPAQISGDGADDRRSNYAKLLAAKIRLAFPTAVVADLVRRGTFALSDVSVEPADVADFLNAHQGKFAIGI